MRELLNTLGKTLLDIGNFGMLLVLFMYIYALVGLQFFANRFHFNEVGEAVGIGEEGYYTAEVPRSNFDTLMNAFTTIFEVRERHRPRLFWPFEINRSQLAYAVSQMPKGGET